MSNYTYTEPRGPRLSVIKTSPNNIILKEINKNIGSGTDSGINGGYFYSGQLLSIAVNNDIPACGAKGGYGSGWYNEKYARGTLVWDKSAGVYSVQVVRSAAELKVSNRNNYWAQGGISMSLKDDANWEKIAIAQGIPDLKGSTYRTGLVWNSGFNIWLVISEEACTAKAFRGAVKYLVGSGTVVDGIFLDAGGSTQMKCKENTFRGDGRAIVQMIALKTP
ncbi:hypothetical protein [Fictibacillus phosphorivorans]|uniref:hypothetical protein n=1 Tax=Fictibacillus phosphorivorans TaxID=1221500 RepID=UPI00203C588C|nr:hypothetical protein [Fictibacillus phosphorivorans]MCM3717805.1 hypothetical protein [Fictibacillus phosphorivorans]MCM3777033.1 hypothetical protein [Fictibacillus phosphorivorans]